MKIITSNQVRQLKLLVRQFDPELDQQKQSVLSLLASAKLPAVATLKNYVDVLLFICAFPPDKKLLRMAENELTRITIHLKKLPVTLQKDYINSGLPFVTYTPCYSMYFVEWLLHHPDCKVSLKNFDNAIFDLSTVLKLTLPSVERSETTAGLGNEDLLNELQVPKDKRLWFILNEINTLDTHSHIKEHLYDGLGIYIDVIPRNKFFSEAYNRIPVKEVFFQQERVGRFNVQELFNRKVAPPVPLTQDQKTQYIRVVKNSMALTDREIDPNTYLDENSFRYYELEHGLSIAIYGMCPQRQLPLESFVGYTLFKNGFPAIYAGGWVFGKRSDFGTHIFKAFRGAESGYMLCQLLRFYIQVFQLNYFVIEPYQYGLDNPEGIESGAFWFYYRYGFRPLDKKIAAIAKTEYAKILKNKNYRTPKKILEKFTGSNIALQLDKKIPTGVFDITTKIMQMIRKKYKGDRYMAEQDCIRLFLSKAGLKNDFTSDEHQVLQEVALWAEALKITDPKKIKLLGQMVQVKPVDLYRYQLLLLEFFDQ